MSPHQHIYDRVVGLMADQLCLVPQVDPADDAECRARWRMQRIAEVAIQEFGPEAKAIVQARLAEITGSAGSNRRNGAVPADGPGVTRRALGEAGERHAA